MAGMIAANVVQGLCPTTHWELLSDKNLDDSPALILDVREPKEYQKAHVAGALHIPLGQIRERLGELPRGREIWVHCAGGQRSYYATRILQQNGFKALNLSGGFTLYQAVKQFKPLR